MLQVIAIRNAQRSCQRKTNTSNCGPKDRAKVTLKFVHFGAKYCIPVKNTKDQIILEEI